MTNPKNDMAILLVVGLCMLIAPAKANENLLTLEEAAEIAVENNFSIQIADRETEIAGYNYSRGNAGFFPTIGIRGNTNIEFDDTDQEFVDGSSIEEDMARSRGIGTGLFFEYPLFTGFERSHHYRSLEHALRATQQEEQEAIEQMLMQVSEAYYDVRRLQKLVEVTEESIEISEDRVAIAERRYEVGSASRIEKLQARADLNEERALLLEYEDNLSKRKVRLNELLAREPSEDFAVEETVEIRDMPGIEEQKQKVAENNPSLNARNQEKMMAEEEIGRQRAQRYPQVDFNMGYDYDWSSSEAGFVSSMQSHGWNAGVSLRMNLFDGFNINRNIQNAQLFHEQTQLRAEEEEHRLKAELEEARVEYENALTRLDLERENAEVVEENVEVALEQYEQDMIIAVELREAQNTLLQSQARLHEMEFEAKVAESRLLKLTGSLEEELVQ